MKKTTTKKWEFEPGHTAAEFKVRHMMVSWVRGSFKNIKGTIYFDAKEPEKSSVKLEIDAKTIWTGDAQRDDHLRSEDFLDVEKHPKISFSGDNITVLTENDFQVSGDLTIRGITKKTTLDVRYLGQWDTPWWEGNEDKGPKKRAGFVAKTKIKRHDFKVSWNSRLDRGGVVVGDELYLTIDVEAVLSN